MSAVTPWTIVGPMYAPSSDRPVERPSIASVAPAASALSIMPRMRSRASQETTGPTLVLDSMPSPTVRASVRGRSSLARSFHEPPTATMIEPAMQRWPAAPKAEPMMLSAVLSMIASGMTSIEFLAPPSAWTRFFLAAARS